MANGDGTLFFSGLTIDSRDNFVLDPCTPAATVETSRPGLAISEIQRITLPTPSGGTYDVTVTIKGDSQTATNIPYDASAAQLRVRLGQLSNIGGTRNILVSGDGSQLFPFELEFVGDLGITNVDPVTVNAENLIGTGTAVFRTLVDGTINSKQRMTIDDSLQPYSFRFNGFTTIRLPYDATLSQVQSALSALPSIRLNNIIVTGLTTDRDARYIGPLFFEFTGALAGQPMPQMSVITTGNYIITTDSVGGANGAAALTSSITEVTSDGDGTAVTLADGVEGQLKFVTMVVNGGGDVTLTPDSLAGADTTITFANVGESCTLLFTNSTWCVVGVKGAVVA
jgi:hypothetical protein